MPEQVKRLNRDCRCLVTGEPMGGPARHRRRAYRHPADRALCLYSATPSLTCQHTMRAVPLSLKISPLKRNTFPAAIALEFSICVLLSTYLDGRRILQRRGLPRLHRQDGKQGYLLFDASRLAAMGSKPAIDNGHRQRLTNPL